MLPIAAAPRAPPVSHLRASLQARGQPLPQAHPQPSLQARAQAPRKGKASRHARAAPKKLHKSVEQPSIQHTPKNESLSRSVFPRSLTIARLQHLFDPLGIALPLAHHHQRSHYGAHHGMQKGIAHHFDG